MSDISTERLILSAVLKSKEFAQKYVTSIKPAYFDDPAEQRLLGRIVEYFGKYNKAPEKATLLVDVKSDRALSEKQSDRDLEVIQDVCSIVPPDNPEWLADTLKTWAKRRSVFNALREAIAIHEGNSTMEVDAIPELLMDAINVDFDIDCGLEYLTDAERRWDYYHSDIARIPFRVKALNEITKGGVGRKTANFLVGGTNVGKSFGLCALTADYVRDGVNVLYITCEMSEDEVGARIDQNMLDVGQDALRALDRETFTGRIRELQKDSYGQLFIKEFPTGEATAMDVQRTIDELRLRKGFVPDVVVVDYLTIMASFRSKSDNGSYSYYKHVSAELRALAKRNDVALWSAVQFNRNGLDTSDAGMSDISESTAIAHIADLMIAIFRTEEFDQIGQVICRQLKNRYANKAFRPRFSLGADIDRQKLFDVDEEARPHMITETVHRKTNQELKEKFGALVK